MSNKFLCVARFSRVLLTLLLFFYILPPASTQRIQIVEKDIYPADIRVGAERTDIYFPWIAGKNIAVLANHTATIGKKHLVDSLLSAGMKVKKVFSPEHGFRGQAEAGAHLENNIDKVSGLPVVSLYGKNRKPKEADLEGLDVVIFDIQDVGARFYTYISSLHYMMEACAENGITLIVLDRPNPNGHYVDGPVLKKEFASFVGVDPIPIVHGCTVAEYACMVNGEGWLENGVHCDLKYVTVSNYNHTYYYHLPIAPSPNLASMEAIWLYPSLCLFEGTVVSVGRGTDKAFTQIGHPSFKDGTGVFTPRDLPGIATDPPFEGQVCQAFDLAEFSGAYIKNLGQLYLFWLMESYAQLKDDGKFFTNYFDYLAGTDSLRKQIESGVSEEAIRESWQADLKVYKQTRKKYILYPDFE